MRQDLENKLRSDHSEYIGKGMTVDLYGGIAVDDGWYDLLDKFFNSLKNLDRGEDQKIDIMQIKEKFGGLRVYFSCLGSKRLYDEVTNLVSETEEKSLTVCERCGHPGKLRSRNYWMMTACDTCLNLK